MRYKRSQKKNKPGWLSIVIVGRNEAANLERLFNSLPRDLNTEWIYVDSQSEDDSINIALKAGAKTFLVDKESVYAAATGRYIGTLEAAGCWILYLDGDMALCPEFIKFMESTKKADKILPKKIAGFVGRTINCYIKNESENTKKRDYVVLSRSEMGDPLKWGKSVNYHGGAVLYRRAAVLETGNWNPALTQLEEVELCSRIIAGGYELRAVDLPMVCHYVLPRGYCEKIMVNFLPRWRGKELWGAGQTVTARLKERSLWQFVKVYPYPFVVLFGIITAPLLFIVWPPLPFVSNIGIALWLALKKKWYYYLVYMGNLFQIIWGLGRHKPFQPRYRLVKE